MSSRGGKGRGGEREEMRESMGGGLIEKKKTEMEDLKDDYFDQWDIFRSQTPYFTHVHSPSLLNTAYMPLTICIAFRYHRIVCTGVVFSLFFLMADFALKCSQYSEAES